MNAPTSGNEQMINKVSELTIYFWIIKIMGTTVGETVAYLLAVKLNIGLVLASVRDKVWSTFRTDRCAESEVLSRLAEGAPVAQIACQFDTTRQTIMRIRAA